MRDLDILVRPSEAQNANQIQSSLGIDQTTIRRRSTAICRSLRFPGRAGTVEIHTEALSFPARMLSPPRRFFRAAVTRNFAGATFRAPPPEWHLLHGLLHHQLADRGHARRMLAIKGLWEFSRVGSRDFAGRMERHHRACRAAPHSRHAVELGDASEPAVRA